MPLIDQPGIYRAEIESYELQDAKESNAVAIAMNFRIVQIPSIDGWQATDAGQHVYGNAWIIRRDGTVNEKSQEKLMQATGWDGQFESILDHTWEPWPCQITVEAETYQGNRTLKVAWVNHWDSEGGGLRKMDLVSAKAIADRHASQMRASAAAILEKTKADQEGTPGAAKPTDEVPF